MKRFELRNGILHKDGRPTFAIGTSYYASFHPLKRTEPEGTDPYPSMRLDVRDIAAAGFNNIRTAALGETRWEGGKLVSDTAFIDALIAEAASREVASIVRLNGYTMDFDGGDTRPVDAQGRRLPPLPTASCFIQQTLYDEALNRASDEATRQLAAHYGSRDGVVGFQVFNEPCIEFSSPETGRLYYDYRPATIAAFRRWLADEGHMDPERAARIAVPVPPMSTDEDWSLWGLWQLFGTASIDALLIRTNAAMREGAPGTESFTNFIVTPVNAPGYLAGSWFGCAGGLDILGLDSYAPLRGEGYYAEMSRFDSVENAAAAKGRRAWLPEVCCRTHETVQDYEREAYAAVGAGYKGVSYYLWRGDLCGPEVQLGGMVWNDRTKTAKFDEAVKVNFLLQRYGETIVTAERVRDGVGILESLYALAMTQRTHSWFRRSQARYRELKALGVTPVFADADSLAGNPLGVRLLFVPDYGALSAREKAAVDAFAKDHAVVLDDNRFLPACGDAMYGVRTQSDWCFRVPGTCHGDNVDRRARFLTEELLAAASVRPVVRVSARSGRIECGTLANADEGCLLVSCVNVATDGSAAAGAVLTVDGAAGPVASALYVDRNREIELPVDGNAVALPSFDDVGGFFVILRKKA